MHRIVLAARPSWAQRASRLRKNAHQMIGAVDSIGVTLKTIVDEARRQRPAGAAQSHDTWVEARTKAGKLPAPERDEKARLEKCTSPNWKNAQRMFSRSAVSRTFPAARTHSRKIAGVLKKTRNNGRIGLSQPTELAGAMLLFLCVGCARDQDYIDVMNDQLDAFKEVTDILKTVKDSPSMDLAKKSWTKNAEKYAAIARARTLCPSRRPPRCGSVWNSPVTTSSARLSTTSEAKRVAALPGGADLLKHFESTKDSCRGAT